MQGLSYWRLFLLGLLAGTITLHPNAQTLLVVNQNDSDVGIVDPATSQQIATIPERLQGVHGHEIAVSPDGRTAYLPIYGSVGVGAPGIDGHQMLVIDLPTRTISQTFDFGHGVRPHLPVMDATHHLLYVTTELDQSVTLIDLRTLKVVGSIPTRQDQSHMLVISHNGRRGYTANVGHGTVSVLDLKHRKCITVIPISATVQRIAISSDDKLVFTADQLKPQLAVINTATNQVTQWVPLPGKGYGMAPTHDGHSLLVAIPSLHQVAVVDLATMQIIHRIDVPGSPQEIMVRPDGQIAYVSCGSSQKVAAIDLEHWNVQSVINAGKFVDGLAWAN
jgi:YVTN family beta-propeller protein